jgi:hypothetical protein
VKSPATGTITFLAAEKSSIGSQQLLAEVR